MSSGYGSVPVRTREQSWVHERWALAGITALVGACALASIFFFSVFSILRNSEPASLALQKAQASPVVVQTIGVPLKTGWVISGHVHAQGSGGDAELAIPVIGPKGKGTLYAVAVRHESKWHTIRLNFAREGESGTQDLLAVEDGVKSPQ